MSGVRRALRGYGSTRRLQGFWRRQTPVMKTRKLLIALATAGLATAALGPAVFPANADPRTFQIKTATGQTVTVTVDVPPGTPIGQISFPGVSGPIVSITEITPPPDASTGVDVQTQEQSPPQQA